MKSSSLKLGETTAWLRQFTQAKVGAGLVISKWWSPGHALMPTPFLSKMRTM